MRFPRFIHALIIPLIAAVAILPVRSAEREVCFLAWDDSVARRSIGVIAGEKRIVIGNLHPLQRSEPVRVRIVESRLGLMALDRDEPEAATFSVAVPRGEGRLLVLVRNAPSMPSGLSAMAFIDSIKSFPWGAFRMVNATDRSIVASLGGVVKTLPAGFTPLDFDAPPPGNHPVILAAENEPGRPVYSSVWSADPDTRRLVFVLPGDEIRLGRVALKVIPEFRREDPANR